MCGQARVGDNGTMSSVKSRAYAALAQSLIAVKPDVEVDAKGFVADVGQNLIAGLDPAAVELAMVDLGAGGGQGLDWKILVRRSLVGHALRGEHVRALAGTTGRNADGAVSHGSPVRTQGQHGTWRTAAEP